jgi:hypothetical protein
MKSLINIIIIILALLTFSCYGQKNNSSFITKNGAITEIIDPIENIPFSIKRDSVYTKIPDSLGINQKGFTVLELFINDKSKIKKIQILRLYVKSNDSVFIDYTQDLQNMKHETNIPMNIQRYYPFLEEYIKTIKITNTSKNTPKLSKMSLMVRFR